jgi:hypothetical protein
MIDSTTALPVEDDSDPRAHPLHRAGEEHPWKYGPYRIAIIRRVSEEEQVSIECYESTRERARDTYDLFITSLHDHMVEYNERVQNVHRHTMQTLDREIDLKAQKLHQLDAQIERRRLGLPDQEEEDD